MTSYRFVDLGPTVVDVTNRQFRALLGLRGEALGFNWETAALYSQATVRDVQDGISATLLQQNLALSTPDAYNPFSGGNPDDPTGLPISAGNLAAGGDFRIKPVRRGKEHLAQREIERSAGRERV